MTTPPPDAARPARQRFDHAFFRDVWHLAAPYFLESDERWNARGLLALVLLCIGGGVYINLRFADWLSSFYDALQHYDNNRYWELLGQFVVLAFSLIAIQVYQTYLSQLLDLRWRRWLTGSFLSRYLAARTYYHLELFRRGQDNPDQRIAEDLSSFAQLASRLFTGLLSNTINLMAFIGLLWVLSAKVVLPWNGAEHHIPGLLVWVALVYATVWTWGAARIANPLIKLNYDQQRYQADFRFALMRLRENSEAVALYGGEAKERDTFDHRFDHVYDNYSRLIVRQKSFNWFNAYFNQFTVVLPFLVTGFAYFAKIVQMGFMMKVGSAFGQVQAAFAYVAQNYDSLAQWHAVVDRLRDFVVLIEEVEEMQQQGQRIVHDNGAVLQVRGLRLRLPSGAAVVDQLTLEVRQGERMLVTGRSGIGKSTLLRALAGLWPFGEGYVSLPRAEGSMFLPQRSYLPLGNLRDALLYPANDTSIPTERLDQVLTQVGLQALVTQLDVLAPWAQVLSLGEQQRLAMARALLQRPAYLFLDEATSALDEAAERELYTLLVAELPQTALVSVGHRSTLQQFHDRRLEMLSDGAWLVDGVVSRGSVAPQLLIAPT